MATVKPKVAVAAAFSPRLRAVLAESRQIAEILNADLEVVHAGNILDETKNALLAEANSIPLPQSSELVLLADRTPEAILQYANTKQLDLLIAGAVEKEVSGRNFLGTFARELFRKASCSVLLFTTPQVEPRPFRRIILIIDPGGTSTTAFELALELAEQDSFLYLVSIVSPLQTALADLASSGAGKRSTEEIQARLDSLVEAAKASGHVADSRVIESATGNAVSDFAKTVEADLLIVPAHSNLNSQADLPRYMDWVLQRIPCNLWFVKG